MVDLNKDRLLLPDDPDLIYPGQQFETPDVPADPQTTGTQQQDAPTTDDHQEIETQSMPTSANGQASIVEASDVVDQELVDLYTAIEVLSITLEQSPLLAPTDSVATQTTTPEPPPTVEPSPLTAVTSSTHAQTSTPTPDAIDSQVRSDQQTPSNGPGVEDIQTSSVSYSILVVGGIVA